MTLWLLLTTTFALNEVISGAIASLIIAAVVSATWRPSFAAHIRLGDLRGAAVLPWRVIADTGLVIGALGRRLAGRRVPGRLLEVRLPAVRTAAERRGARAIQTILTTISPNAILVDFDEKARIALVHTLIPRGHVTLDEVMTKP
jgi:multisubunit Na+/H+ antiporter MnhE subunit